MNAFTMSLSEIWSEMTSSPDPKQDLQIKIGFLLLVLQLLLYTRRWVRRMNF